MDAGVGGSVDLPSIPVDPVGRNPDAGRIYHILYAGPALAGRTTTLEALARQLDAGTDVRLRKSAFYGDARRLESAGLMELTFLIPGSGRAARERDQVVLRATPGPLFSSTLYEDVTRCADGIVFVIDSQAERVQAAADVIARHERWLRQAGRSLAALPCVVQYNKRDLPTAAPISTLEAALNPRGWPFYEAVALRGTGVLKPFRDIVAQVTGRTLPAVADPVS